MAATTPSTVTTAAEDMFQFSIPSVDTPNGVSKEMMPQKLKQNLAPPSIYVTPDCDSESSLSDNEVETSTSSYLPQTTKSSKSRIFSKWFRTKKATERRLSLQNQSSSDMSATDSEEEQAHRTIADVDTKKKKDVQKCNDLLNVERGRIGTGAVSESEGGQDTTKGRVGRQSPHNDVLDRRRSLTFGLNRSLRILDSKYRASEPALNGPDRDTSPRSSISNQKLRLILVGDPGVGKSTFLQTLVNGQFMPANKLPNLMTAHTSLNVEHDGQSVELDIQDTAGQERFRSLTASYYRYAHGCLVFFNVNDKESFRSVTTWLEDIHMYNSSIGGVSVVLVGLLHRAAQGRGVILRSSKRGETIRRSSIISLNSSMKLDNNNSTDKDGDDDEEPQSPQPKQNEEYEHQIPRSPVVSTTHSPLTLRSSEREIPKEQAEHLASLWGIPYREVDTKDDFDGVLEAVHALLDLVFGEIWENSKANVNSIVPESRHSSLSWSQRSGKINPFICCANC